MIFHTKFFYLCYQSFKYYETVFLSKFLYDDPWPPAWLFKRESCSRTLGKINIVILKVSDGGQNKVITTTNHHYFCSSCNFFCNCKWLPNKYWFFTQNSFTFFINHSNTMKWSFVLSFYMMTHDPLHGHSKEKAAVEPELRTVLLEVREIWTGSWTGNGVGFLKETGKGIFRGT